MDGEQDHVEGKIKCEEFEDLLHPGLTQNEVEPAFKEAEEVRFNCGVYDDAEEYIRLDKWEIEVQIGDTIKQFQGEF